MDLDIDTDEVLNLEEQNYHQGFNEGHDQKAQEEYLNGKEYGLQTGFQRFLIVGYIRGLVEFWKEHIDDFDNKSLPSHLYQLEQLLDSIPVSNEDQDVAEYDRKITKARNKVRLIATLVKQSYRVSKIDELIKEIGGSLHLSEDVNESW